MPTASGHTKAIRARKVIGTPVKDPGGRKIGEIEDVVLDKLSNNIMFAAVSFGGFLGVKEKYHPIPWSMREQGEYFFTQLRSIGGDLIRDVRGRGLMLAVELHPHAGGAYKYCERLRDKGLLAKDTHVHTLRLAPPLLIKRSEVDYACEILAGVLK